MSAIEPIVLAALVRESLQKGQPTRLTVSSNSMAPLLRPGDEIVLEPVTGADLVVGDILTLASAQGLLTHRYWATQNDSTGLHLLTRGDRPLVFDPPWPQEAVVGRMVARVRGGRELALTTSRGRRLNRHLVWLAKMEYRLWGSRGDRAVQIRPSLVVRLLRRGVYSWATLVVGLAHSM
jgi:signal peptidase I